MGRRPWTPPRPRPRWRPTRPPTTRRRPAPQPRPRRLRFAPQNAVRWFSPGALTGSGLHVGLTSVFGSFLDKRELQARKAPTVDRTYATRDEVWIDYVADTGDGFEATATVAATCPPVPRRRPDGVERSCPAATSSCSAATRCTRGPAPRTTRTVSRGRAGRLCPGPWPTHPAMYAVPGNHDWYDGLTGFLRLFGQGRWIGGWTTRQTRSYLAVQLPHHWWLWGVDIQPDRYVDEPQLEFFGGVAAKAAPGAKLILATPVPTWTELDRDPNAYRNLAYLERTMLRPDGIVLKLTVAGDLHHYSRYGSSARSATRRPGRPTHKITTGGGGAFLHPTHALRPGRRSASTPTTPATGRLPHGGRLPRPRAFAPAVAPRRWACRCATPASGRAGPAQRWRLLWTIQFGLRSLGGADETFADGGRALGLVRPVHGAVPQPARGGHGRGAVRRAVGLRPDAALGAPRPAR